MNNTELNSSVNGTFPKENSNFLTDEQNTARIIFIVWNGIVIILGSIGNIVSLVVLRSGELKKISTCFYMSVLAMADTGKNVIGKLKGPVLAGHAVAHSTNFLYTKIRSVCHGVFFTVQIYI